MRVAHSNEPHRTQARGGGGGNVVDVVGATNAVVVVEDVITTGGSAHEAITAVESQGGRVLGVLAVVDREEGGRDALERAGYAVEALVTASELLGKMLS